MVSAHESERQTPLKDSEKVGQNVAQDCVGQKPPNVDINNSAVRALPAMGDLALGPVPQDGKPGLVIVEDEDDVPGKGGKGLSKGDIARLSSTLNMIDGGMILPDRQKLRNTFKEILKDADEQQKKRTQF